MGFVFHPQLIDFILRLLTGVPIFDLEHGDKLVELGFRLVHNVEIVIRHQDPARRGLAPDRLPVFLKNRFVDHGVPLLGDVNAAPL